MRHIYKFFSIKQTGKGFTLIELLIVMAILGILAAALVAVINPGEQIKKANDSQLQTTTLEVRNAILRYTANHAAYPWDEVSDSGEDCLDGIYNPAGVALSDAVDCLNLLVESGEISGSIIDNDNFNQNLYITEDNSSSSKLMVCYKPQAKFNIDDSMTAFTSSGENTCEVGSGECYWCVY